MIFSAILKFDTSQLSEEKLRQIYENVSMDVFCIMAKTYSKTCVKESLSKRPKIGFQDQLSLNAGQKYCRMLILQYFRPSLSYHLS